MRYDIYIYIYVIRRLKVNMFMPTYLMTAEINLGDPSTLLVCVFVVNDRVVIKKYSTSETFEVLTGVLLKMQDFLDITLYQLKK